MEFASKMSRKRQIILMVTKLRSWEHLRNQILSERDLMGG
jgi:hypothetical protein